MHEFFVDWERGSKARYEELNGNYVMSFQATLQGYGENDYEKIGTATVIMTDDRWRKAKRMPTLVEQVHVDFNEDLNWNAPSIYEYLEDTLRCTQYGVDPRVKGKIARLLNIRIDEQHRGNGYFSIFFEKLLDVLEKWSVDVAAVMPSPFGDNDMMKGCSPEHADSIKAESEKRLRQFYESFGFIVCDNEGVPYMIKPLSS